MKIKNILKKVFSISNEGSYHKVLSILGIKFKFISKYKKTEYLFQKLSNDLNILVDATKKEKKIENILNLSTENKNTLKKIISISTENKNIVMNALRVHTKQPNLKYLEVHLTEHCNLNCQSCTHFSPLATPEFTDIKVFESDIKRISELTNGDLNIISLMGGEPLLHPQCSKFLEITRKYLPKTKIKLVTNGILLLKQSEEFWESMKKFNITLSPTKYPIDIDWSRIKEIAEKYGVFLQFYNCENVLKTSYKIPLVEDGSMNATTSFSNCWIANNCTFLKNGKIYGCVFPATISHFNKYFNKNIPVHENDGIDIYKVNNIDEILNFLSKPMPFCSYCKMKFKLEQTEWCPSKKEIKEWS